MKKRNAATVVLVLVGVACANFLHNRHRQRTSSRDERLPAVAQASLVHAPPKRAKAVVHHGYCSVTQDKEGTSCLLSDLQGTWPLFTHNEAEAAAECVAKCIGCRRCNWVSYSAVYGDCSWFSACNVSALHSEHSSTHRTMQVRRESIGQLCAPTCPEVQHVTRDAVSLQGDKQPSTPPLAHQVVGSGHCGETTGGGHCALGSSGSWSGIPDRFACLRLCEMCPRCRFISFSRARDDCSWYSSCAIRPLEDSWSGDDVTLALSSAAHAPPPPPWRSARDGIADPSARPGYCGIALVRGDCTIGDSGVFEGPSSLPECAVACTACARCAVISWSNAPWARNAVLRGHGDCSWYAECDLDDLRRPRA